MKTNLTLSLNNTKIRQLENQDLDLLRSWRNNSSNTKYLSKIDYISRDAQKKWFDANIADKESYTFAIEETEVLKEIVGSLSLYNLNSIPEIGKILIGNKEAHGKKIGFNAFLLSLYFGFKFLKINTFICKVHEKNIPARITYERVGFKETKRNKLSDGFFELEMIISEIDFFTKNEILINKIKQVANN